MSGMDFRGNKHKQDYLNDFIVNSVEWIKNNRNQFNTIAITVVIVIAFAAFIFVRFYSLKARGADKLAIADGQIYQGNADQGMAMLNEVVNSYGFSSVGIQARIAKADYLMRQGNYEDAIAVVKPATERTSPKELIPMTIYMLGVAYENTNKFDDALAAYGRFSDKYPSHYLAPKVYEAIARVYELSNKNTEAIAAYEKLGTLYPATPWAARAKERIDVLNTMAQRAASPAIKK